MAESGAFGPAKSDKGAETSGNGALSELRELLIGPERAQLNELRERITDRSQRANDLSEVLPEAIRLRGSRDPQIRKALQTVIEDALAISVRRDPAVLAKALFPAIGKAIRRAVGAALQEMIESLNQIIETSVSFRSLAWRVEAARTGRPYGEVVLLRSLLYRVEQVFLIQDNTGLLLQHVESQAAVVRDPDMVSGMLTAIQNFVQDSFEGGDKTLEVVRLGDFSLWIQHGPSAFLAAVVRGTPPPGIREVFLSALEILHRDYGAQLASKEVDAGALAGTRPVLETCLLGRSAPGRAIPRWPVYLAGALCLAALLSWIGFSIRDELRWRRYIAALAEEPGIVVTHQEKSGRRFGVSGLRDPLSRDPAQLLHSSGIPRERVTSHWEPYLSLSPRFVALRDAGGLRSRIEQQVIYFDTNESSLTSEGMSAIQVVADLMRRLCATAPLTAREVRIELAGHTDESGLAESNRQLGMDRATTVRSMLVAAGVDGEVLTVRSAGSGEPRTGSEGRDRKAENRSVTFRVVMPAGRVTP